MIEQSVLIRGIANLIDATRASIAESWTASVVRRLRVTQIAYSDYVRLRNARRPAAIHAGAARPGQAARLRDGTRLRGVGGCRRPHHHSEQYDGECREQRRYGKRDEQLMDAVPRPHELCG